MPSSQLSNANTPDNGQIQSLAEYHWHRATWDQQEVESLRQFFILAIQTHPTLESQIINDFANLPSVPLGSETPAVIANYFLASGASLSDFKSLTSKLRELHAVPSLQLTTSSIVDYVAVTLAQTTRIAFGLNANNIKTCNNIVTALQKLFFFHNALLSDLFTNTESFNVANFDEATGLPDYRTVLADLSNLLAARKEVKQPLALLVLHVTVSHLSAGGSVYAQSEGLYVAVAERLKQALREMDIIGRFGRDKFLIVLPRANKALASLAAQQLIRVLEEPFDSGGRDARGRPTIGISLFPDHGDEAEVLLHCAEMVCEDAKQLKRSHAIYHEELHIKKSRQQSLETKLRVALKENSLEIYFQPQADVNTGRIIGAEALLRWRLPEMGVITPIDIIDVAEVSGLSSELTNWVLKASLRQCANLAKKGIDISVSVNVTASNLSDPDLVDSISDELRTWNITPSKLIIELTEGSIIGDSTIKTLENLKALGISLSVDDFGTGYSCMAYLKKMPLDELKVDRAFVHNMLAAKEDERIVRSVIDLAHHFDLKVVAEGVEDLPTLQFLRSIGCDIAQGYLISKPLPVAEFTDWWLKQKGQFNLS